MHPETQQTTAVLEKKLDLLLRTGQLLMQSGANSDRIDRNVKRIALHFGISGNKLHMHITLTTLMMTISDGTNSITKFKKILEHGVNMTTVDGISRLTWKALEKGYSPDQYKKELNQIADKKHAYPRWLIILSVGLACGGFSTLFGGDWSANLIASFSAATGLFIRQELHKKHINNYLTIAVAALISSLIAGIITSYTNWTTTPQDAIAGAVLFLVPGVLMINSLDDMIGNFTIIGTTRAIVTILCITSIAFGMIVAMQLLGIKPPQLTPPAHNKVVIVFAGALSAAGFAVLFNVPFRTLWLCALGGSIAVLTRNILRLDFAVNLPIASLAGALLSSTWATYWVHKVHTPGHVISIPPVIPMVPGVLAYTSMMGMFSFAKAHDSEQKLSALLQMFSPGIEFVLTLLCIALGVTIPNFIDRFYSSKAKQKRIEMAMKQKPL
ncbi:threonine/serine exporter family protein [Solitalea sp. MAHUQ-68]|uniref:Threonine/serine exporter family protein n=1 Tax=Solitalea agri TaxID=2953739 RepID=A0A9X2JE03_9SPHI|nr:threonine/serine exporter family protein [Solitalea agri]MCO4293440.1 threonine/serine exporter family protein [Solitalea agri]